jgi:hypothetical protein
MQAHHSQSPSAFRCTFIVPCKGRLSFLRRTVGSIVSQPNSRLVVVDYDCPDRCGDWIEARYPQCGVVRVHDQTFSLARARNLGAAAVAADDGGWLCFLDADVVLAPDFCERVASLARAGTFLIYPRGNRGLTGLLIVASADFARSRGYDERYEGYGREASDMRLALFFGGLTYTFVPSGLATHLPHDDGLRTRFYAEKDVDASNRFNTRILEEKIRAWERSSGVTAPAEISHLDRIPAVLRWSSRVLRRILPKPVRSFLRRRLSSAAASRVVP